MKFALACGDVMPGCAATFEAADEESLMAQIADHAGAEHQITVFTPEILAAVNSKISVSP